jgi:oligopeptide/dipeptide ABC transporter ATP-binding protein
VNDQPAVLEVQGLRTAFPVEEGEAFAVDGVSLRVERGRTLGVVGESGCGKSLTALSILRLVPPPGRIVAGRILLDGVDLLGLDSEGMRRIRGRRIAMIFQEPMTSLNPVYSCGEQIAEVLRLHEKLSRRAAAVRSVELLAQVGLPDPRARAREHPHQLSGGMRQRVLIAMAVACRPEVLVADEPTTALDVTIRRQILALLHRLQEEMGMALLHITHDLGVLRETAHRVAVMYAGRVVEEGPTASLFAAPAHPYTLGLLASRPRLGGPPGRLPAIGGTVPEIGRRPAGCSFEPRCPFAVERCRREDPGMETAEEPERRAACFEAARVRRTGRWPLGAGS